MRDHSGENSPEIYQESRKPRKTGKRIAGVFGGMVCVLLGGDHQPSTTNHQPLIGVGGGDVGVGAGAAGLAIGAVREDFKRFVLEPGGEIDVRSLPGIERDGAAVEIAAVGIIFGDGFADGFAYKGFESLLGDGIEAMGQVVGGQRRRQNLDLGLGRSLFAHA